MSKMDAVRREAETLQAVILAWQHAHEVTALGEMHRVSLAHAILCARSPSTLASDDAYFDVYALGIGHVLTEQDVADIQKVLKDFDEEMGERVDEHHRIRTETLREIGGDELVAAAEAADDAMVRKAVAKAIARYDERRAAHEAGSATDQLKT